MEEQMSNSVTRSYDQGLFGLSDEEESDSEDEASKGAGRRSGGEFDCTCQLFTRPEAARCCIART